MNRYNIIFLLFIQFSIVFSTRNKRECKNPLTTASGSLAPKNFCSGDLIFEDNFNSLDPKKWQHEVTLYGGGNQEFEWYTSSTDNSFTKDGQLNIRPTLTSDFLGGDDKLYWQTIDLGNSCTNSDNYGCKRTGTRDNILNPIRSARLNSKNSFSFKYGKVQIRAKMPAGDWLWPALWMLPHNNKYGTWPRSGEIDIVESRGNKNLQQNGHNIGTQRVASTLHWGPDWAHNGYTKTSYPKNNPNGYDTDFKNYEVMWTPDYIKFSINGEPIGTADPKTSFWDFGQFAQQGLHDNPWAGRGKMAPFDQEFFLILNLAVGGTNSFFPDDAQNYPSPKPWKNSAPHPMTDFWNGRQQWLPTWKLQESTSSLKVDYVRVWAL